MLRQFITFLLLLPLAVSAQQKEYTLNGFMAIAGGETFSYKLVFTEAGGKIDGYSLTYLKSPQETKATIIGVIDRVNRKMAFKEETIVYEHGLETSTSLCLVDAHLTYNYDSKQRWLTGAITSKDAGNSACAGGTLLFSNEEELTDVFTTHDEMDITVTMHGRKPAPAPVPQAKQPEPEPEKPQVTEKVTAGIEKAYDWQSDTVGLEIWDGGGVDGDIVTILFNGHSVLSNYSIIKSHKQLRLPLEGTDVNTITIVAVNNGQEPPNTASLLLTDGKKQYPMLSYNEAGNKSIIKIRKVQQPAAKPRH